MFLYSNVAKKIIYYDALDIKKNTQQDFVYSFFVQNLLRIRKKI